MEGLFKNKYKIPSTRLSDWDYSSCAYYFITLCTHERAHYFGDVLMDDGGKYSMALSDIGKIARDCWLDIPNHFFNTSLDEWVIMPNHMHGIIVINNDIKSNIVETCHGMSLQGERYNQFSKPIPGSLSMIVNHFKGSTKRECNRRNLDFHWQTRFYDHIIRTEKSLYKIRRYIINNPLMWHCDRNNPDGLLI